MPSTERKVTAGHLAAAILAAVRDVVRPDRVALHEPTFDGAEWNYVKECLDTGWVSSVGAYVDRFEAMLAEYTGAKYVVATSSGTAALHVCLIVAGIENDDEVLIPSLTFVATANAVRYVQATPHLIDIEPSTLGIAVDKLDTYLSQTATMRSGYCRNGKTGNRIKAVIPMHTFGHPVDIDALTALCERWNLALIEDAAESLGSWYKERHTGTFGVLSCLSFNGNKIVTTGGGGAILTNDESLYKRAKHLTTTARLSHQWQISHDEVGYNYRLPNLNAALGCAQLESLPQMLAKKRCLARRYVAAFGQVHGVSVFEEPPHCRSNYWLNVLLLENPDLPARDEVLDMLNREGVMARPVWTPMHRLKMYRDCPRMDLAQTEMLERQIINIPSSAFL